MTKASVLITVTDGTVDYCVGGDVQVVLVDFDKFDLNTAFPDDVDRQLSSLRTLPAMPWVTEIIRRLSTIRSQIGDSIRSQPPPHEEVTHDDDSPG